MHRDSLFDDRRSVPARELIGACLRGFPAVPLEERAEGLEVRPSNDEGFVVRVTGSMERPTVWYNSWHHEFDDPLDATRCFLFGLTAAARLKVFTRGNWEYRWQAESQVDGEWGPMNSVVLMFFPFWRAKRVQLLQNDWIPIESLRLWIDDRFTSSRPQRD